MTTYKDWTASMAACIQYRMKAMDITVQDLAFKSGIGMRYILKVVDGELYPSFKAREALGKVLGCSLEFVQPRPSAPGN